MTMTDHQYSNAVFKHRGAELQARAQQEHLAKIARQAAKKDRAARREARRLQIAVHGRQDGFLHAIGTLFGQRRPASNDPKFVAPQSEEIDQLEESDQQSVTDTAPASN